MKVLILAIILIALAVLETRIYIKRKKDWNRIRLFLDALIICLLFSISYFITDTSIGLFYVFSSFIIFISIGVITNRGNVEWQKYLAFAIGLPFLLFLMFKSIQNMLVIPSYILFLLSLVNAILSYPYKRKGEKKENIALVIGLVISVGMLFSYYKFSGFEDTIIRKQELVAYKYLEELDIYGAYLYIPSYNGSLRGEEVEVRGYDPSGSFLKMIYKNNEIISYEIIEN